MAGKKVCPECGCESFKSYEQVTRAVIIDGDSNTVKVCEDTSEGILYNTMTCIGCKNELTPNSLVTEEFFHEVVALAGV